jgi:acyl carrier protein
METREKIQSSPSQGSSATLTLESRHRTAAEIENWLIRRIASIAEIEPGEVDLQEAFSYYGLDSVAAIGLSAELEDWLGCRLSPTLTFDYPTLENLSGYLAHYHSRGL